MKNRRQVPVIFWLVVFFSTSGVTLLPQESTTAPKLLRIEENLEKVLGTKSNWKPEVFKSLRWGMSCQEVNKVFPGLVCNSWKQYDFPKVPGKPLGSVDQYQFTFKAGKLESVTIIFNARLFDANQFKEALLAVCQRKWGALPPGQLKQSKKSWYNADRDAVALSFIASHWQLMVNLPRREAAEIPVGALSELEIRLQLEKLLGTPNTWGVPVFAKFRFGMYCAQVQQIYKTISGCDASKTWSFGTVIINGHPLVQSLKFAFNLGQLHNAAIIFHPQLDRLLFKKISLEQFEQKWGRIESAKRENDILSIYKEHYGYVQRSFRTDHWEIRVDFAK